MKSSQPQWKRLSARFQIRLGIWQAPANNNKLTTASRNALEVTIVHEMMHGFMDEALTNGMTGTVNNTLVNDNFPKWFIEGMAQSVAGGYYDSNDWVNVGLGIVPGSSLSTIETALNNNPIGGSSDTSNYGSGYLACMYLGYLAGGKTLSAQAITSGLDTVLSDIKSNQSLTDVVRNLTGYTTLSAFQSGFAGDAQDSKSIGVSNVNVYTADSATLSIERVSLAIAQVSAQRAELGARRLPEPSGTHDK